MINTFDIGGNIRSARYEKGLTQSRLAKDAEISQTQLSDYENGNKTPGLHTIGKIAQALGKTIDELYFGDSSVSYIASAPDKGRLIVNCIYQLWAQGILGPHSPSAEEERYGHSFREQPVADLLAYSQPVVRLLETLDDFGRRSYTYKDPDLYLEQVLGSVAREIGSGRLDG